MTTDIKLGSYVADWAPTRRVNVSIEIRLTDQPQGQRLSITGTATGPGRYEAAGQCLDEIRKVTQFAPGWDAARRDALLDIWERWHLNDMRAECEHQRARGEKWTTHPSAECPDCGYKLGSAWLYEPLPADVLAFVGSIH